MKILPVGAELFRTERLRDMPKLSEIFRKHLTRDEHPCVQRDLNP